MNTRPRLTVAQMVNMSVGFFGIQFAWAIQMGQMSGIYERLGATSRQISWLWIAGPITGMIIQPIVGHLSDMTWGRLGRRRPYFLTGAIIASLVLVLMPNSPTLWVAAALLWILDASINISMEPFRALVADLTPEDQRGVAYSFQSFAIGLGSVISFGIGGILILECISRNFGSFGARFVQAIGPMCPTSLHALFYIGAAIFITTIAWTVVTTTEYPPENKPAKQPETGGELKGMFQLLSESDGSTSMFSGWFAETWKILAEMPENMRRLCLVHSLTWFGFFCIFIFFSPMVAANIFNAKPNTAAYDQGIAWASWCYLALNVVCFASSLLIGRLTRVFQKRHLHAVNLVLGGLAMMSVLVLHGRWEVLAAMGVIGICWASTLSLPYALLSGSVERERYGVFMGAFNIFICLPQVACSLLMGPIVDSLGGNKAIAMMLGGLSMLAAAASLRWVKESAS